MTNQFVDTSLALRLEAAHASAGVSSAGEVESAAGGKLIFAGVDSPINQALGLGLAGPVTAEEFDRVESFFRSRGVKITIDLCPLADISLIELLAARGYRLTEFNNVLARPIREGEWIPAPPSGLDARPAAPEEVDLLTRIAIQGFFNRSEVTPDELVQFRAMVGTSIPYLLFAGGQAVAGAVMGIHERVATMAGDATLPEFRGRGAQAALIHRRLRDAQAAGCDLAWAATLPGSVSQRNYERCGFRMVYTRAMMVSE
jgi:GNAT superfamily N-acetyltransferase